MLRIDQCIDEFIFEERSEESAGVGVARRAVSSTGAGAKRNVFNAPRRGIMTSRGFDTKPSPLPPRDPAAAEERYRTAASDLILLK
ncbi:hypothetical protein EVAR_42040_1 [Eumeta japonica]|uniref:Uncharacterized protein n=1 Tax=Eumeta variegata TaxID=151549 RepID=A0A4C1YAT4_EUMVA|nr:hypothetical protein EVAR_42040_1 [Eumeta japonica]